MRRRSEIVKPDLCRGGAYLLPVGDEKLVGAPCLLGYFSFPGAPPVITIAATALTISTGSPCTTGTPDTSRSIAPAATRSSSRHSQPALTSAAHAPAFGYCRAPGCRFARADSQIATSATPTPAASSR